MFARVLAVIATFNLATTYAAENVKGCDLKNILDQIEKLRMQNADLKNRIVALEGKLTAA